jgi:hypothetical protein
MNPFAYPAHPHDYQHGPFGYAAADSYRAWLRDEFSFRCVYCMTREGWASGLNCFHIDHFLPTTHSPELEVSYVNLLYCCSTCNSNKRDRIIPNPLRFLLAEHVTCDQTGRLIPSSYEATLVIEALDLNRDRRIAYRKTWMDILELAEASNPTLYRKLLGYPDDLPDLSKLKPPGGNSRPEGLTQSHYERRLRGELPETY